MCYRHFIIHLLRAVDALLDSVIQVIVYDRPAGREINIIGSGIIREFIHRDRFATGKTRPANIRSFRVLVGYGADKLKNIVLLFDNR